MPVRRHRSIVGNRSRAQPGRHRNIDGRAAANLKGSSLGIAALSVTRSRDTYFAAKYRRICARRGPMKALVAVERAMVVAAHGVLTNGDFYRKAPWCGLCRETSTRPTRTQLGARSPPDPGPVRVPPTIVRTNGVVKHTDGRTNAYVSRIACDL